MAVDSMSYLNLGPLLPVLTLPILLPSGRLRHTTAISDASLSSCRQPRLAFHRRSFRDLLRDGQLGRQDRIFFNCRSMLSDEYWRDGMKKFEDVSMQCSRDWDNVNEPELRRSSLQSTEVFPKRQACYAEEANKLPSLIEGISIPLSLKKMRKQQVQRKLQEARHSKLEDACAINKTFSSMVFILLSLQIYTLPHFFQDDVQGLLSMVHREMQSSFIWLFQQVFACTPKLMVSVMILLTNFTVHSVESKIIRQNEAESQYSRTVEPAFKFKSSDDTIWKMASVCKMYSFESKSFSRVTLPNMRHVNCLEQGSNLSEFRSGNGKNKNARVASGSDAAEEDVEYLQRKPIYTEEDTKAFAVPNSSEARSGEVADVSKKNLIDERHLSFERLALDKIYCKIEVAPVKIELEPDDYLCYDLTDLAYQQALGSDSTNPLLLANYAQFLYAVKHDYDRAQACFELAVKIDPSDSEAMSRFAMFLWLARRDRLAAEKIFKIAITVSSADPFHKGNYAHFLWHAQEEEKYQPTWSGLPFY